MSQMNVRNVVISDLTGVTHTRRHDRRDVSEDGREAIEVEDGIADRVLVDADVTVAATVTLDQSLQRFGLEAAESPGRLLQIKIFSCYGTFYSGKGYCTSKRMTEIG